VDLYLYKANAEKTARKAKGVTAVRNLIAVGGPIIADRVLTNTLQEKLSYDRMGYGSTFNAIGLRVENGAVTLSGHARTGVDAESALILVSTYPGVKEVMNEIQVDPVSMMDDETRTQIMTAVYGFSTLSKYWVNPAKPIRISVQNGHVELYGTVDSKADKDVAYMRANGVPGVFSVTNYLQVAGEPTEIQKK
jgi:osmotically-inducible protein OsmY